MGDWLTTAGSIAACVVLTWLLMVAFGNCGTLEDTIEGYQRVRGLDPPAAPMKQSRRRRSAKADASADR